MTKAPVKLSDLFRYYKHGTPHQMAAIVELEAALLKVAPNALNKDQPWFKTWSQAGKAAQPKAPDPVIIEHPIEPGDSQLLGGAMEIKAPWKRK